MPVQPHDLVPCSVCHLLVTKGEATLQIFIDKLNPQLTMDECDLVDKLNPQLTMDECDLVTQKVKVICRRCYETRR